MSVHILASNCRIVQKRNIAGVIRPKTISYNWINLALPGLSHTQHTAAVHVLYVRTYVYAPMYMLFISLKTPKWLGMDTAGFP